MNCSSLEKIDIPKSVTSIGSGAFSGCSSLKEIEIPKQLKLINKRLFYNCSSLEQIIIPASVSKICDDAFSGCSSLKKLELHVQINEIGHNSLDCINLEELILHNQKLNLEQSGIPDKTRKIFKIK